KGVQSANGPKRIVVNCGIQVTVRKGKGLYDAAEIATADRGGFNELGFSLAFATCCACQPCCCVISCCNLLASRGARPASWQAARQTASCDPWSRLPAALCRVRARCQFRSYAARGQCRRDAAPR